MHITLITNKHFGEIALDCVWNCAGLTQASDIEIIYRNVSLKCFFIHLIFCYYR